MNKAKEINATLIKTFDNIKTNIDTNDPLISEEVKEYAAMGGIYNELMVLINDLRAQRKLVESAPGMNSEKKRQTMNEILAAENMALQQFFTTLAGMDLDFGLSDTLSGDFPLGSLIELKTQNKRKN